MDIDGQDILFHVFDTAGKVRSATRTLFLSPPPFLCLISLDDRFKNLVAYQLRQCVLVPQLHGLTWQGF